MSKLVAALLGFGLVAIGGVAIVHYGKSWFGWKPEKIKIWIDEKGCQYEGNLLSAAVGDVLRRVSSKKGEEIKLKTETDWCLRFLEGDIDWDRIEVDWDKWTHQQDTEQYKNAKKQWDERKKNQT